jgi:hypothetical protein
MSSDTEKKSQFQQFAAAPQIPQGAYPYMQGNVQFQPVYYQPVPYDVATSVNGEAKQSLLGAEGEKKCFFQRICKKWKGRRCQRTVHDDGRSLGNLNNFIAGLVFGTISPFFSLICIYGFESKKLTRTGALFGHANFFLLLAFSLLAFGKGPYGPQNGGHGLQPIQPFNNFTLPNESPYIPASSDYSSEDIPETTAGSDFYDSGAQSGTDDVAYGTDGVVGTVVAADIAHKEDSHEKKGHHGEKKHGDKKEHREHKRKEGGCKKMFKIAVGASLAVGLVFMVISMKSFRRFMVIYRTRENKAEADTVKAVSEAGNCRGFFLGMIASILWPMVGTALVLIIRRKNLTSRYGAIHGLGVMMVIGGIVLAFHGIPPVLLFKGLLLCQISSVHFKRAIASANAVSTKAADC